MFCREDGGPRHRSTALHQFQKLLVRAGLPELDLHDLRHAAATRWIAKGADPTAVQELLGHTSLKMTLGLYTHAVDRSKRAAVDQLDAMLDAAR